MKRAGAPDLRRLSADSHPTACAGCVLAMLLVLTIYSLPGQGSSLHPDAATLPPRQPHLLRWVPAPRSAKGSLRMVLRGGEGSDDAAGRRVTMRMVLRGGEKGDDSGDQQPYLLRSVHATQSAKRSLSMVLRGGEASEDAKGSLSLPKSAKGSLGMVLRGGEESDAAEDGVLRSRVIDLDTEDWADKLHLHDAEGGEGEQWRERAERDGEGETAMAKELEVGPSLLLLLQVLEGPWALI